MCAEIHPTISNVSSATTDPNRSDYKRLDIPKEMPTYEKLKIFRKLELDSYKSNGEGVATSLMELPLKKLGRCYIT